MAVTRAISLITVTLLAAPAIADDLVLVADGQARAVIVAAEQDEASAAELQTYLAKMSGAELPIVAAADAGPRIVLGGMAAETLADFNLGLDGYVIRREGEIIHLAGSTPTGTRNAVYRFLDRLGVRWYFPGELGEVVPARPNITLGDLAEVSRPDFLHRSIWPSLAARGMSEQDRAEWYRWLRRNLYGGVPVHIGHNFHSIAPAGEHFAEHPEWYALRGGRREPSCQLCTSNPEVIAHAVEMARRHFDADPAQTMFSLSPDDNVCFCHCPDCDALDPPEFRGTDTGKGRRLLIFANQVAERLQQTHPGKNVAFYAYWGAVEAPTDIEAHPNVIVFFTPIGMAFNYPLQDPRSPTNRTHNRWYLGWNRIVQQMGIRHYYNFSSILWIPWRVLTDELRYEYQHNARYLNAELIADAEGSRLSYWILARVLWDTDADIDALFDDYITGLYGVAADPMRRYYTRLTEAWSYGPQELRAWGSLERQRPFLRILTPQVLSACRADLRKARYLARDDAVVTARIRISQAWLNYMSAWRTYAARVLGEEPADVEQQAQAATEFIAAAEPIRRYAPGAMPEIEGRLRQAHQVAGRAGVRGNFEPAFPDAPTASPDQPPTLFRGSSRHLILSTGVPFEITIGHRQVGRSGDPVRWHIRGPGATDLAGEVAVGGSERVLVDPAPEGIYSVMLEAGSNAASIESSARYLVHDVTASLHIVYHARPLYFTVPFAVAGFSLSLSTTGPAETVHVAIINPEGEVAAEQDVIGTARIEVEVPAGMSDRPWRVELSQAATGTYEDVMGFRFSEEIPPYISDAPGRLLVED